MWKSSKNMVTQNNLTRISLGLGTVQLGVPYGNKSHAPVMKKEEAFAILKKAVDYDVHFYDTAITYGESEARLGEFFSKQTRSFDLSTKIPRATESIWKTESTFFEFISMNLEQSRARLGITKHNLVQFHQCDLPFLTSKSVQNCFSRMLENQICEKIGVSIYDEAQAAAALSIPAVSALQVPCNLVDTRFAQPAMLKLFEEKNTLIILRSVVMQGLLIDSAELPLCRRVDELRELKNMFFDISKGVGQTLESLAFGFVFQNCKSLFDVALIGVDSVSALDANFKLIQTSTPVEEDVLKQFSNAFEHMKTCNLLNPSAWL